MKGLSSFSLRDDRQVRARALLIARIAIVVYVVELLFDLTRPHVLPDEPTLSLFYKLPAAFSKVPEFGGSFSRLLSMPEAVSCRVIGAVLLVTSLVVDLSGGNTAAVSRPSFPPIPAGLPTGLPSGRPSDLPSMPGESVPSGFPTSLPIDLPSLPGGGS